MKCVNYLLAGALAMTALVAMAADSTKGTGWISDSMCGAKHSSASMDKSCVQKCISGGMKPVFVDSKNTVWSIDNPAAVKAYYGDHVQVSMSTNPAAKSVHINTITAAK